MEILTSPMQCQKLLTRPGDPPSGIRLRALHPTDCGTLVTPNGPVFYRYTANGVPKIVRIAGRIVNKKKPVLTIGYESSKGFLDRNLTSGVRFFFNRVR